MRRMSCARVPLKSQPAIQDVAIGLAKPGEIRDGCVVQVPDGALTYKTTGTQALVDAIRAVAAAPGGRTTPSTVQTSWTAGVTDEG